MAARVKHDADTQVAQRIADRQVDSFMRLYSLLDRYEDLIGEHLEEAHHGDTGIRDLGTAIQTAINIRRDLYGLPNEQQLQGRERLKLMHREADLKQRLAEAQLKESAGEDEGFNIVIHMEEADNEES